MLTKIRLESQLHGQRRSWRERFPFISPILASTKEQLPTAKRATLECLLEALEDQLDSTAPLPPKASVLEAHFVYLACLFNTIKSLAQVQLPNVPPPNQAEWEASVKLVVEALLSRPSLKKQLDFFTQLVLTRIVCHELDLCGRYCSFSGKDIEVTLYKAGVLLGPLYASGPVDDLEKLRAFRQLILSKPDSAAVWRYLERWFGCPQEGLLTIGILSANEQAEQCAFGTARFGSTFRRATPKAPVNRSKAESWEYIKVDLRRLTDAMCGLIPPEEVQRLSFYKARKDKEDEANC